MKRVLGASLAILLAGCLESEPPVPAEASPDAAIAPDLQLTGCTNFGGVFPVPMASARAVLPPDFEPIAASLDPANGATLYVLALRCEGSSVDGVPQGPAQLAYAELAVSPPPRHQVRGIADYTVPVLFTAAPAAVGEALAALRLGRAGAGSVSWGALSPAAGTAIEASLDEASLALTGEMPPGAPSALGSGDFVVFGVQEGAVRTTVLGSSAGGEAVQGPVRLESSGAPAPVADARSVARGFSVSGFDLRFRLQK